MSEPATDGPAQRVSVHNTHCHLYGICEQEAPEVFQLRTNGRLAYQTKPAPEQLKGVRQAARLCPTQAITIKEQSR